ncbi:MAG: hypothetical protein RMJ60_05150 [Anaerolineales bacterium]|nr:hypothetical protein [Anaerolineales bacterium]
MIEGLGDWVIEELEDWVMEGCGVETIVRRLRCAGGGETEEQEKQHWCHRRIIFALQAGIFGL